MDRFQFDRNETEGIIEVALIGKVKTTDIPSFEELFEELLRRERPRLVLDCSRLDFLNSKAVGILLKSLGRLRKNGGEMVVFQVNDQVMEVFRFLTLDRLMAFFPSREEALAHLQRE